MNDLHVLKQRLLGLVRKKNCFRDGNGGNVLFYLNSHASDYEKIVRYLINDRNLDYKNSNEESFVYASKFIPSSSLWNRLKRWQSYSISKKRNDFYKDLGLYSFCESSKIQLKKVSILLATTTAYIGSIYAGSIVLDIGLQTITRLLF